MPLVYCYGSGSTGASSTQCVSSVLVISLAMLYLHLDTASEM